MLGTVPAAALVGLDAPAIALPAEGDAAPLQEPKQVPETDLIGTAVPTLEAAGPPIGDPARVVLPTALAPDEAETGIVPAYEGPQPAAIAPGELGTDTVSADTAGSRSSLAALAPETLGTDSVSLNQTALPVTPALDREGTGGNGLFSAAEAAQAADRYEAAARRGQVGSGSGDAILAQALRELFPLLPDLSDDTPTVEEEASAATQVADEPQDEDPSELEADAADDAGLDDDEQDDLQGSDLQDGDANRRRGRRGRRGGRGRRRNGAGAPSLDADGREAQDDDDECAGCRRSKHRRFQPPVYSFRRVRALPSDVGRLHPAAAAAPRALVARGRTAPSVGPHLSRFGFAGDARTQAGQRDSVRPYPSGGTARSGDRRPAGGGSPQACPPSRCPTCGSTSR